jgi:C_GCAxxG_C_C family probable redox protein
MDNREIKKIVIKHFSAGFLCAEVITRTLSEIFADQTNPGLLRSASAFCGGIGGSTKELCGAFTGGILMIGHLQGRDKPGESMADCGRMISTFRERFISDFGTTSCPELLKNFEASGDSKLECVRLTTHATAFLAEMIDQEMQKDGKERVAFSRQPGKAVPLGQCPFTCNTRTGLCG